MTKQSPLLSHARMIQLNKIKRKSSTKSPVALAWEIYNRNPRMVRKDAINLALAAGIAFYTARTQYQAWRTAGNNDRKAAEKSKQLMARMGLK